ncbi:MAG: thiolase family protein [Sphingomonadaceae bacterium]
MSDVFIVGIGIHPFGRTEGVSGLQQGAYAARQALADAGVEWKDIQFGFGGSDAAGNADSIVNELGLTGLPFINVKNGCATGGSAMIGTWQGIASGQYDLGMALGFDKHPRGAFNAMPAEYSLPEWYGETGMMVTTQFFAMKLQRYMEQYGITSTALGRVAEKAFENAVHAEHAWRRAPVDLDTILNSQMINDPLTKYMFCSPAEGGVALILANEKKARELGRTQVRVKAAVVRSRPPGSFEVFAPGLDIERGGAPTLLASAAAFEMAGLEPKDIDVAQLQDTESGAEIMHMAENGFCAHGDQEKWLAEGWSRIGGRLPINTDGGCLACGEPIGASGLRQVYENAVQLRGMGGGRQVPGNPKTAYTHVYGAPGVSGVTILQR